MQTQNDARLVFLRARDAGSPVAAAGVASRLAVSFADFGGDEGEGRPEG